MAKEFVKKNTTIDVMGVKYKIMYKNYEDDAEFTKFNAAGFCDFLSKEIVICNIDSIPNVEPSSVERQAVSYKNTLRHEIIHAFLFESGLSNESHSTCASGWATDEEIIDWMALQTPKMYTVFEKINIL